MKDWLEERSMVLILGLTLGLVSVTTLLILQLLKPNDWENHEVQILVEETSDSSELVVASSETYYVDIKGAVNKPGMYEITSGTRLIEGLELAGGLVADADADQLNFAQLLVDQMVIYVPKVGEEIPAPLTGTQSPEVDNQPGLVNINRADRTELQQLPGIGAVKAEAIIAYREEHGSFQSLEDLSKVNGFGKKTVERLKPGITY